MSFTHQNHFNLLFFITQQNILHLFLLVVGQFKYDFTMLKEAEKIILRLKIILTLRFFLGRRIKNYVN